MDGDRGREPGKNKGGRGGVQETGEERAGSGILKVAGTGRNFVIFCHGNGTKSQEAAETWD